MIFCRELFTAINSNLGCTVKHDDPELQFLDKTLDQVAAINVTRHQQIVKNRAILKRLIVVLYLGCQEHSEAALATRETI